MRRRFFTLDVFADTALAGNPLAVVLDAAGLDDSRMQKIAGEFNLAETVFVFDPGDPVNTARLRIFTPARELPFAGHPTVGTAALLAHVREPALLQAQDLRLVLEEKVGDVVCVARHRRGQALGAYFTVPKLPMRLEGALTRKAIADRLGLASVDVGFDRHAPSAFSAGVEFQFAPLASREAVDRADPAKFAWGKDFGRAIFLYARGEAADSYYARMFAAGWGIREDPATGSAVAAFAGVAHAFETLAEGETMLTVDQGVAMGRPSVISLGIEARAGALVSATIGGQAVIVSQGTLDL
jgi:trans-2,3-dihydro-3-hydroxyanthranilate isomerase